MAQQQLLRMRLTLTSESANTSPARTTGLGVIKSFGFRYLALFLVLFFLFKFFTLSLTWFLTSFLGTFLGYVVLASRKPLYCPKEKQNALHKGDL